jgi:hypothetical protein
MEGWHNMSVLSISFLMRQISLDCQAFDGKRARIVDI